MLYWKCHIGLIVHFYNGIHRSDQIPGNLCQPDTENEMHMTSGKFPTHFLCSCQGILFEHQCKPISHQNRQNYRGMRDEVLYVTVTRVTCFKQSRCHMQILWHPQHTHLDVIMDVSSRRTELKYD